MKFLIFTILTIFGTTSSSFAEELITLSSSADKNSVVSELVTQSFKIVFSRLTTELLAAGYTLDKPVNAFYDPTIIQGRRIILVSFEAFFSKGGKQTRVLGSAIPGASDGMFWEPNLGKLHDFYIGDVGTYSESTKSDFTIIHILRKRHKVFN